MASPRDIEQLLLTDPNPKMTQAINLVEILIDKKKDFMECHKILDSMIVDKEIPRSIKAKAYRLKVICYVNEPTSPKPTLEAISLEIKKIELFYKLALELNQPEFDAKVNYFFADWHFNSKPSNHEKAFFYAQKSADATGDIKNINERFECAYTCGVINQNKKDYINALKYFELVCNLYLSITNTSVRETIKIEKKSPVGKAAANAATILDIICVEEDIGIHRDPVKVLRYYELGAAFGIDYCLHNLGYKYENGEDVEADADQAIDYYTTAANLHYTDSILNLFCILLTEERDVSSTLPMMFSVKGQGKIYHCLGVYYFKLFIQATQTNPAANDKYGVFAHDYFFRGAQYGSTASLANLGLCYEEGIGVKENLLLAEKYYLDAIKAGRHEIISNLAFLYRKKLLVETDPKKKNILLKETCRHFVTAKLLPVNVKIENFEQLEKETQKLRSQFRRQCIGINVGITSTAKNNQASFTNRIAKLLKIELNNMDVINVVTTIHRIGFLTEKCLDKREFHGSQRAAITNLLTKAEELFAKDIFDAHQIVNLIEGISKLYWLSDNAFINRLYAKIFNANLTIDPRELVTLVVAATRLNCETNQFQSLTGTLFKRVIAVLDDLDAQDMSNLCYAMAILHNKSNSLVSSKSIRVILASLAKNLVEPEEYIKSCASINNEDVLKNSQRFYFSIYYFSNIVSLYSNDKLKRYLVAWVSTLDNLTMSPYESNFQKDVTGFLEQYFGESEHEKVIGTRPVDAYFQLTEDSGFILQADGPSHFLHDDKGGHVETPKTLFRNKFHSTFHPLIISVPYFKWEEQKTDLQKHAYLTEIFKTAVIELPAEKWTSIKSVQPKTLFRNRPEGKEEKSKEVAPSSVVDPTHRHPVV